MLSIYDRVADILTRHLGIEASKIKPELRLEDLGADSLDRVELVYELEDEFNITIPDSAAQDQFETVQNIVDYVTERLAS